MLHKNPANEIAKEIPLINSAMSAFDTFTPAVRDCARPRIA
jgi:hypothetical protein